MKKYFLLSVALTAILCGCRTPEYYQDQAVQSAREFLLKKSPQLSYEESAYIRFNKPVILHNNIIGGTSSLEASTIVSDMNQIQIVWNIPGQDVFYSVWGACSSTMRDFTPERLFVREFRPEDTNRKEALKRARAYIIGNLFSTLSVEDYNDLRFSPPEIYFSRFELEKSLMPVGDEVQFAFVWILKSNPENCVAVIGNAQKNLSAFKPLSGSILPLAEARKSLNEQYKFITPKELRKIEDAKKAEEAKKKAAEEKAVLKKTVEKTETIEPEPVKKAEPAKLADKNTADSDFDSELDKNIAKEEKIVDDLPAPPELEPAENIRERDK